MISSKQRFTVLCILDLLINFDITYVESDMMNGICLKLIRLDSAQSFQSCAKKEKKSQTEFVSSSCFAQYLNDH